MMWRLPILGAALFLLFVATPVAAQEETVLIQFDVIARGQEGEVVQVGDVAVDPSLVGTTCFGTVEVRNNESAHPNNDFIISSGGTTIEIPDFERTPGGVVAAKTQLVLGETITVSIRLGADRVASLSGDTVVVASPCAPEETTTTLPSPSTTGAVSADTTTTLEAPVGGVSAGGGGTAAGGVGLAAAFLLAAGGLSILGSLALTRKVAGSYDAR